MSTRPNGQVKGFFFLKKINFFDSLFLGSVWFLKGWLGREFKK